MTAQNKEINKLNRMVEKLQGPVDPSKDIRKRRIESLDISVAEKMLYDMDIDFDDDWQQ